MQKKRGRAAFARSGPFGPVQAALRKKRLSKKTIQIKLQVPIKSYAMLTEYVAGEWLDMTLEKKLQDVITCWIDKAISHCLKNENL